MRVVEQSSGFWSNERAPSNPHVLRESYVNDIGASIFVQLCDILDINGTWKKLVGTLPDGICSAFEVHRFEQEMQRNNGGPSAALLHDLGNKGMTVGQLISHLEALQLERALVLIKEFEPVSIWKDLPSTCTVQAGPHSCFRLECHAQGFPRPNYQWFKLNDAADDWREMKEHITSTLEIQPVRCHDAGVYCCRVWNQNPHNEDEVCVLFSSNVVLRVDIEVQLEQEKPSNVCRAPPTIVFHPFSPGTGPVAMGSCLLFECRAKGAEPLTYEWYRSGVKLEGEHGCTLQLKNLQPKNDETKFSIQCKVSNPFGDTLSKIAHVSLAAPSQHCQFVAEDKVALLIGNQHYCQCEPLKSAVTDVRSMGQVLRSMDFKVLAMVNLDQNEMRNAVDRFCKLLDEGVYGVFYYAGHGFQWNNHCYMVPVDAVDYDPRYSLCVEEVKAQMQACRPALCSLLLDMCRKETSGDPSWIESTPSVTCQPEVTRSLVCAYATTSSCTALDGSQGQNSVFTKYLLKHLASPKPLKDVLWDVLQDVGVEPQASRKQNPMTEMNLCLPLRLVDSICHQSPSWKMREEEYARLTSHKKSFQVFVREQNATIALEIKPLYALLVNILMVQLSVKWPFSVVAMGLEPSEEQGAEMGQECHESDEHNHAVVIIKGLQKIRRPLALQFGLLLNGQLLQAMKVSLDFPMISKAHLWQPHDKLKQNTKQNKPVEEDEEDSGFASKC